jgi:hypothetical protein
MVETDKRKSPEAMRRMAEGLLRGAEKLEKEENARIYEVPIPSKETQSKYCLYASNDERIFNDPFNVTTTEKAIANQLNAKVGRTGCLVVDKNFKTKIIDTDE